ncbi:MAG: hypothetical protein JXB34_02685 [Bacteroidales bacterium]|nr:hypothetical protein [Bacteroidales bacterium]
MKRFSYIFLTIAFFSASCSEKNFVITEDSIPSDIFYLENEIKPFTGKCTIYYRNTETIKETISFKKGVLNGEHTSYYKNGQVKRKGSYVNGCLHGKWTGYDMEGHKVFEAEYKNDTLVGRFITWYSSGVIREKGSYKNNHRVGEWHSFDEAGMTISKVIL